MKSEFCRLSFRFQAPIALEIGRRAGFKCLLLRRPTSLVRYACLF